MELEEENELVVQTLQVGKDPPCEPSVIVERSESLLQNCKSYTSLGYEGVKLFYPISWQRGVQHRAMVRSRV